jgi:predicted O-linked N-acetylglucosamine transferase (SPINDLY family)
MPWRIANQALDEAIDLHRRGHFKAAEECYRQVLALYPDNAYVLHLAGIAAGQDARPADAIELIQRAIAVDPTAADYHSNLGKFQNDLGLIDQAIFSCRQALQLDPSHVDALNNLGIACRAKGDVSGAIEAYRAVLKLKPDHVEACNNLGTALCDKGLRQQAIAAYRQAISLRPDYADAHSNLSAALRDAGQLDEAIASARRAIALKSDFVHAWNNLGNALRDNQLAEEAIEAYQKAISINPGFADAINNLGMAFFDAHRLDEALTASEEAERLLPESVDAPNNLGNVYKDQGRIDQSIACYRRAALIAPHSTVPDSNLVYATYFHPAYNSAAILQQHRLWDQRHAQPLKGEIRSHDNDPSPARRLRIGYVSPDFRDHVVGRNLLPLLQKHDPDAVEIFCYSDVRRTDNFTAQFQSAAHHWQNICGMSDADLAERVRNDRIDILLDLSLHMAGNRLLCFARKPAPVQVTFAGYPGTTGLSAMDYRLTDPQLDPPGEFDSDYAEKSIRLADSFWCYQPAQATPEVNPLPALSNGFITFGCLNNFCKINDQVLELWAVVLAAVPKSRLLLLTWPGEHRRRLHGKMQDKGIDGSRIEFASLRPPLQYLALYHRIDIGLDTFPYNGHTTSLDSYWMGVPVVTLSGRTVVGRAGVSQLTNLGMTELIANTPQEYVRIAGKLADDLDHLMQMRGSLRDRMAASPLMDATRFARSVETAYRQMWK